MKTQKRTHSQNAATYRLMEMFRATFNSLSSQSDLSPENPVVNEALSAYVGAIVEADEIIENKERVLSSPFIARHLGEMTHILSRAEFEMERYFADLLSRGGPMELSGLSRFWYRANYEALVRNEIAGIKVFCRPETSEADARPMAFVGSGPLPLSAIDYHLQTGKSCVCIEIDHSAAESSRKLIDTVGLSHAVRVIEEDGARVDYSPYGMVFVAALVANKDEVLGRVHATAKDVTIGVRSAEGLKKLLYTPVDIGHIRNLGYEYCGTTHGTPVAVNSTCFFRIA